MLVRLELGDLLLPVRIQDVAVVTRETLVDLQSSVSVRAIMSRVWLPTFCQEPVKSCGSGAWFCAAIWTKYQRL
jgi:hypothetical protein